MCSVFVSMTKVCSFLTVQPYKRDILILFFTFRQTAHLNILTLLLYWFTGYIFLIILSK